MATTRPAAPGVTLVIAAFAATCAATVVLLVVPTHATATSHASFPAGSLHGTRSVATLLSANGLSALPTLLVPIAVSSLPLLTRRGLGALVGRVADTVLLLGFVVLGAMTVGIFYLPAAVLMGMSALLLAVARERRAA